jgi:hypothetical protein
MSEPGESSASGAAQRPNLAPPVDGNPVPAAPVAENPYRVVGNDAPGGPGGVAPGWSAPSDGASASQPAATGQTAFGEPPAPAPVPSARRRTLFIGVGVLLFVAVAAVVLVLSHRSTALVTPSSLGGLSTSSDPTLTVLQNGLRDQMSSQNGGINTAVSTYGTENGQFAILVLGRTGGSSSDVSGMVANMQSQLPAGASMSQLAPVGNSQCSTLSTAASPAPVEAVCLRTSESSNLTVLVVLGHGSAQQASAMVDQAWAAQG